MKKYYILKRCTQTPQSADVARNLQNFLALLGIDSLGGDPSEESLVDRRVWFSAVVAGSGSANGSPRCSASATT
jgi:hypothetical protein